MPTDFPSDAEDASLVAKARAGDNAEPLTVSEISQALKRTVEDRFGFVRLRGELSGVKRAASGHMYCALKDEKAVLDGVMWRGNTGRLPFNPEDGLEVVASGKLTTYPGRSKYQIVIERMELAGEGALLALVHSILRLLLPLILPLLLLKLPVLLVLPPRFNHRIAHRRRREAPLGVAIDGVLGRRGRELGVPLSQAAWPDCGQ